MKLLVIFVTFLQIYKETVSEIRHNSPFMNKLSKIKPVGGAATFAPITAITPPESGRRHFMPVTGPDARRHLEDCVPRKQPSVVDDGPDVHVIDEDYDDHVQMTVATIVIPEHLDHKHFEVTTQVPYLTVGKIDGIGYHPTTAKSEHPSECEKIYQDHLDDQYSDESNEFSEESLEMARMPIFPRTKDDLIDMYPDLRK